MSKPSPDWPLWVAFAILAACFVVFVVVFAVYVAKGYKMLSSARSGMYSGIFSTRLVSRAWRSSGPKKRS